MPDCVLVLTVAIYSLRFIQMQTRRPARWALAVAALVGVIGAPFASHGEEPASSRLSFQLPVPNGEAVSVSPDNSNPVTVICFLGTECPLARLYAPKLNQLARQFEPKGVRFIGVCSNRQDSTTEIAEYAKAHELLFPVARDEGNVVADAYGAQRTPEVFVLDRDLQIRYRGRIDDQYRPGLARPATSRQDLRIAIEELLAGKPVRDPETEPVGCFIGRVRKATRPTKITYTKEVSRILQKHCVKCHRAGEIGPFSLTDYDEVIGWVDTMLEAIDDGRMPPWHANPKFGEFEHSRTMDDADRTTLREWVAGGMPRGDDRELPEPVEFTRGWQLPREPDVVYEMRSRPFRVPAEGTVEYQYFVIDPKFEEDRWVSAAQVLPGNRAVVHHAVVLIRPPDGMRFRGFNWLAGYVPGQRCFLLPPGHARRVPAGSKLIFQMHYTPNGSPQSDLTRMGLTFAKDEEVTHEVVTLFGLEQEFEIPPGADSFPVKAQLTSLPKHGQLLAISPHMHLRGKAFRVSKLLEGESQILLDVPRYDFNWQHIYALKKPVPLSDVDSLELEFHFDNSRQNPVNPDPSEHVTWGDQTWQEMAVAFFEVAEPRVVPSEPAVTVPQRVPGISPERKKKIDRFVNRFFKRFDEDQNGMVERAETPLGLRSFGFWQFDHNGDRRLTRDEVRLAAERRIRN